jgi:hypothetical protein
MRKSFMETKKLNNLSYNTIKKLTKGTLSNHLDEFERIKTWCRNW